MGLRTQRRGRGSSDGNPSARASPVGLVPEPRHGSARSESVSRFPKQEAPLHKATQPRPWPRPAWSQSLALPVTTAAPTGCSQHPRISTDETKTEVGRGRIGTQQRSHRFTHDVRTTADKTRHNMAQHGTTRQASETHQVPLGHRKHAGVRPRAADQPCPSDWCLGQSTASLTTKKVHALTALGALRY